MEEKISSVKMVSVTNRDNGEVFAKLSNNRIIDFNKGQTRKVPLDDLIEINSSAGGRVLLRDYLVIDDKEALELLELNPEPEYYYSEKEIRKLLIDGSLDQLEDCLNFAPGGVLDLLKDIALELELPDIRKRKMISEKLGFNIDSILLARKELSREADESKKDAPKKERKAETIKVNSPTRKAEPVAAEPKKFPEYKIIK